MRRFGYRYAPMALNKRQLIYLRGLAHGLKPVVLVGNNGLTEAVYNEIELALEHHELIKIRLPAGDKQARSDAILEVAQQTKAECVQTIGRIGVLYRHNPKQSNIALPR